MNEVFHLGIELAVFLAGLVVLGSAFAVISNHTIDRIPRHQSLIYPSPYCPACAALLDWKDMIPVWSYLRSNGRCPYCGTALAPRKLNIDICDLVWVSAYILIVGWKDSALLEMVFGMGLIIIIFIELECRVLTDGLLLILTMLAAITILAYRQPDFPTAALSLGIGALVLGGYNLLKVLTVTKGRFEPGEIKFGAVLGLFCGYPGILFCVLLSWILGAVLGLLNSRFHSSTATKLVSSYPALMALAGLLYILAGPDLVAAYAAWMEARS